MFALGDETVWLVQRRCTGATFYSKKEFLETHFLIPGEVHIRLLSAADTEDESDLQVGLATQRGREHQLPMFECIILLGSCCVALYLMRRFTLKVSFRNSLETTRESTIRTPVNARTKCLIHQVGLVL